MMYYPSFASLIDLKCIGKTFETKNLLLGKFVKNSLNLQTNS